MPKMKSKSGAKKRFDSAGARQFKTFLCAGLCLHFWHLTILFLTVKNEFPFYFLVLLGAIIIIIRLPSNLGIISTLPNSSSSCAKRSSMISPWSL